MKPGLVSVIIGIRNTDYPVCHYTANCIGSVKEHTDASKTPYEIIVVDNGSTVELGGWKWDQAADKYFKEDRGMSCAWAWNKGAEMAEGEYLCFLSNDVQVFDHWLEDLIDATKHVDIVNACPMYDMPWGRALEAGLRRQEWLMEDPDKYLHDFRDFSCFLMKREVFDKVGTFDENIKLGWGEDIDYCYRLQALGMVNKGNKRVNTNHVGMATGQTLMAQNAEDVNGTMDRNKEYVREKHNLDQYGVPHPKDEKVERQTEPKNEVPKGIERKGDKTIRTKETGDKVYLITGNVAQWVKTLETLNALGWRLGQEVTITLEEFRKYEMGEPLTMENIDVVGVTETDIVTAGIVKNGFELNYAKEPEERKVLTGEGKPVLRYRKSV